MVHCFYNTAIARDVTSTHQNQLTCGRNVVGISSIVHPIVNIMEGELLEKQRKSLMFIAKTLHQAGLQQPALVAFKGGIDMTAKIDQKHYQLFHQIVRQLVAPIRATLRQLSDVVAVETRERRRNVARLLEETLERHFVKLETACQDVLAIIDQQLLPVCAIDEAVVDLLRLEGDLYRYMWDFASGEKRDVYKARCESVYNEAMKKATKLDIHELARLSLVLNRAMFLAEGLRRTSEAAEYAEAEVNRLLATNTELSAAAYQKVMAFARRLKNKVMEWKE